MIRILRYALLVTQALLAGLALAKDAEFISPPTQDGNTIGDKYIVGQTITIKWSSPFTHTDIAIWQQGYDNLPVQHLRDSTFLAQNVGSWEWKVDLSGNNDNPNFDLFYGDVFFFQLYGSGNTTGTVSSQYFYIADDSSSSSTQSQAKTSSTASASAAPASSKSGGDGTAIGVGVGVGVGVGIIVVAAVIGALWFFRRRRQRRSEASHDVVSPSTTAYHQGMAYEKVMSGNELESSAYPAASHGTPHEMPNNSDLGEMPAESVHRTKSGRKIV